MFSFVRRWFGKVQFSQTVVQKDSVSSDGGSERFSFLRRVSRKVQVSQTVVQIRYRSDPHWRLLPWRDMKPLCIIIIKTKRSLATVTKLGSNTAQPFPDHGHCHDHQRSYASIICTNDISRSLCVAVFFFRAEYPNQEGRRDRRREDDSNPRRKYPIRSKFSTHQESSTREHHHFFGMWRVLYGKNNIAVVPVVVFPSVVLSCRMSYKENVLSFQKRQPVLAFFSSARPKKSEVANGVAIIRNRSS